MSDEKESEAEALSRLRAFFPAGPGILSGRAVDAYRAAVLRSSEAETRALVERLRNALADVMRGRTYCGAETRMRAETERANATAWLAARADKKEGGR